MPVNPSNLVPLKALTEGPLLDQETLDQFRALDGGGVGLAKEMLEIFRADLPPRLSTLKDAIESSDMARIAELAHGIKGSCGTIGAMRARGISAMIEASGRGYEVEAAPIALFARLQDEIAEAISALEKFIAESGNQMQFRNPS
jgi:HPt (histidine-containing phosphotransfer) domain-containing protein